MIINEQLLFVCVVPSQGAQMKVPLEDENPSDVRSTNNVTVFFLFTTLYCTQALTFSMHQLMPALF